LAGGVITREFDMDISVIGTGAMGAAMVERLLATDHRVTIYNRSPGRMAPLAEKGAHIAASARDAVEATPLIISLVEHAPAMDEMILTDDIVPLFADKVFMKMTTTNGRVARQVAGRIEAAGGVCLDIAILNFPDDVSNGKMHAMVGASAADFDAWAPLLGDLGPKILRVGEVGTASIAENAMIQIMMFQVVAFAYGLAVFERADLPQDVLMEATGKNPLFLVGLGEYFHGRMTKRDFTPPLYRLVKHRNDMQLTLDDMEDLGIMTDGISALRQLFVKATEQGLNENDYSAVYDIICPRKE
jgi:3-hydroxyisobutyrate dehydrogenase